jgi:hypothetical protein
MRTTSKALWVSVLWTIALGSLGCGRGDLPELGTVKGRVTMAGKPLPNVSVQFHPESGGRPGTGITDSDGAYSLTYVENVKGTPVGPSRVEITTIWPDGEPGPGQRETIQAKYNSATTLKETVKSGSNTFDFALEPGSPAKTKR